MKVFRRREIYTPQDSEQIPVILEDTIDCTGLKEYRIKYRHDNQDFLIFYKPEVNSDWGGNVRKHLIAYNTDGIKGCVQCMRNHNEKHFLKGGFNND